MDITSFFKEGCLVALTISRWGSPRKIPKKIIEERGLDEEWVSGYKKLINPESLKPINNHANSATSRIKRYAFPFPIRGVWFVPKTLIEKLDLELQEDQEGFDNEVEEFADIYEELREEAEEKLGSELFDSRQYPKDIQHHFSLTWRFFHFDVPSAKLGILSASQYKAEVEKMRQTIVNAQEMAIEALRTQLLRILQDAVKNFRTGKRIHSSHLDKFQDFFGTFKDRNIFGDTKLEELTEMCKDVLEDVDIDNVKSDEEYKEEVAENLEEVQELLEESMVDKPIRKIRVMSMKKKKGDSEEITITIRNRKG